MGVKMGEEKGREGKVVAGVTVMRVDAQKVGRDTARVVEKAKGKVERIRVATLFLNGRPWGRM